MKAFVGMAGLLGVLLLGGCSTRVSHGPVSERLIKRLDEDAVSRVGLIEKIKSGEMKVALRPPAERTITIPFRLQSGSPSVLVDVNGKRNVPMVLDTGAVKTMISATDAAENEVTMLRADDVTVSMRGVIGDEKARLGILAPLRIGTWELYGYPCVVRTHANTMSGPFGSKSWTSNLLGFDVAAKLSTYLTIDYRAGLATYGFHQPFTPPTGRQVAKGPFKLRGGAPYITLSAGGHSWEALIDTGSFNGIEINQELSDKLRLGEGVAVQGLYLMSVGGSTTSAAAGLRTVTAPSITVLGETYQMAQVDISPGPPRVGSFFLKDYRVTFDFRRRLVWLEW